MKVVIIMMVYYLMEVLLVLFKGTLKSDPMDITILLNKNPNNKWEDLENLYQPTPIDTVIDLAGGYISFILI